MLLALSAYYFITGIWPLIYIRSFERVTGPKTDKWLVQTFGLVIAVVGVAIFVAAVRDHITVEVLLLTVAAAVAIVCSESYFALRGIISKVYLADAVLQTLLMMLLAIAHAFT